MATDKSKKKLLGEYLIEQGLVSGEQVQKALEEQKKAGARLGQTLIELGYLNEEDLIVALAQQLNLAHIDIRSYGLKPNVVRLIPEQLARRHQLIALEKFGNNLTIAMADPLNVFAIDEVQQITRCRVEPVICSRTALFTVLDKCYKEDVSEKGAVSSSVSEPALRQPQPESKEPPAGIDGNEIIDLVDSMIRTAFQERATDIHVEPDEDMVRVRCRVDGFLRELSTYPKDFLASIVSRIKVLSCLDISEKRIPQDGRFTFEVDGKKIDLRVSTLPTVLGEKVVMRVLDKTMLIISLDKLGFAPENLRWFEDLIHRPYGMILVTGPTSSGKTTTLYSALSTINTIEKNILTVEDPVEYRLKMINQVQVNPRAGLTFATGLRSFLRQDPNVIMIGEIRDLETAEIAVQSALTGHLVLSTIHTNNASSTITRLIDMKIDAFLVSSAVIGIIAQRLIRTICPQCKESYVPAKDVVTALRLPPSASGYTFYKGKGCDNCKGTGYWGRIGIYEMVIINDEIRELILKNSSTAVLAKKAQECGMRTLREDGLQKVLDGITTLEEVLRATTEEAKG
ncbi:MAG: Flp pilus assembly complex ATPase component TadA [Candidatus Omnitrophica bacterium]|nr:Flp pilus assembly complex ATPase component TadA [Candidatus Omnitrophota bacterium]MBU4478505.1 Flp pilus assembly complex ATPase component TadA [Candidatus Omnitrophota bacterium]MCG2704401.1 Flp pilus assembly complex ATPase component TadA [Candidatus Omnitrophota bacterium]